MNNQKLVKALTLMAQYYKIDLNSDVGKTYLLCLEEYKDVDWEKVFVYFIQSSNKFPTVNDIIKHINPTKQNFLTPKQQGIDLVSEVYEYVKKYGWNNFAEANMYMSKEARLLVSRLGGWERVCKADTTNSAFMAQARDLAEVIVTNGTFEDQMIALQDSKNGNKELSSSEDILKSLTELKKDE